jgi:hypothetical protein
MYVPANPVRLSWCKSMCGFPVIHLSTKQLCSDSSDGGIGSVRCLCDPSSFRWLGPVLRFVLGCVLLEVGCCLGGGSSAREKPKSHYGRTRFLRFLLRRCVAGKQWFMQIVSEIKSFSWLKYSYGGTLCFFFCMKSWLAEDRVDRRVRVRRK